jgi:hypothetical protein
MKHEYHEGPKALEKFSETVTSSFAYRSLPSNQLQSQRVNQRKPARISAYVSRVLAAFE